MRALLCHCATAFERINTPGLVSNVDHPCPTLSITSRILKTAIIANSQPWLAQPYRENRSLRDKGVGGFSAKISSKIAGYRALFQALFYTSTSVVPYLA